MLAKPMHAPMTRASIAGESTERIIGLSGTYTANSTTIIQIHGTITIAGGAVIDEHKGATPEVRHGAGRGWEGQVALPPTDLSLEPLVLDAVRLDYVTVVVPALFALIISSTR